MWFELSKNCIIVVDIWIFFFTPFLYFFFTLKLSNGLVVKVLYSQSRSSVFKTTGWLQSWLSFHPSEVDKMSTRNFCELSGKK